MHIIYNIISYFMFFLYNFKEPRTEIQEEKSKSKKKKNKKEKSKKDGDSDIASKKIPKLTKPPISKAKDKAVSDSKKLSAKDLEKLGTVTRKKTEKIALWAENVQNQTKEQMTKKALVAEKKPQSEESCPLSLPKKHGSNKVKDLPKISKKILDTSKKIPKLSKPDAIKLVPGQSKDANFSKKVQNAILNSQVAVTENPFLNKRPVVDTRNDGERTFNPFLENSKSLPPKLTLDHHTPHDAEDVEVMTEDDEIYAVENSGGSVFQFANTNSSLQNAQQQPVYQQAQPEPQCSNSVFQEEESMDIDDAVQFSRKIMKEVYEYEEFIFSSVWT